jgi:Short C-terminal domain/Bacterial PH domain
MPITDSLIADESIVFQTKKHWMAPIRASLWAALMVIGGLILFSITPNGDGFLSIIWTLLRLAAIALIVGGIGWVVYNLVLWRTAIFAVTTMRVLREEGLLSKDSSTTLLSSLSDVRSSVGFLGQRLGYGDLVLMTQSGDAGEDKFLCITDPLEFRNQVMTQKVADRRMDGPTAAQVAAVQAAQAAPAAPAPEATAPTPSSVDSADALAKLADLRDRGAITEAEFEAKKAEILDRI